MYIFFYSNTGTKGIDGENGRCLVDCMQLISLQ